MLEKLKIECQKKNLSIPKAAIIEYNPTSINNYLSSEIKKIENRFEVNSKKTKMFQLAHQILSESPLNETYLEGNGIKIKNQNYW